jgi:hypothetical protein
MLLNLYINTGSLISSGLPRLVQLLALLQWVTIGKAVEQTLYLKLIPLCFHNSLLNIP